MNKFIFALAAFALIGTAAAGPVTIDEEMTQSAIFPDDKQEVAGLAADKQIFRDFCFNARDEVEKQLKDGSDYLSKIYKMVDESFGNVQGFNYINAAYAFVAKLQAMRGQLKDVSLVDVVRSSCRNVLDDIEPKIESIFSKAKEEALASGADEKVVKSAKLDNLGCVTMKRLVAVANNCDFLSRIAPSIM
jgi:hypothetical protein